MLASHSFPLTGNDEPLAPHTTLGTLGVQIFFVTSGFLVTKSWLSEPALGAYLRKRALRIFPGLICAVLVTGLAIGNIFTVGSHLSFIESGATWKYIVSNVCLFPQYVLSTVFTTTPDSAANGLLWTLPVEVHAYLLLGVVGLAGLVRPRVIGPAVLLLLAANAAMHVSPAAQLLSFFAAGSALYLLRAWIVLRADVAALLLLVWLASFETRLSTAAGMLALPYLVACASYCTPQRLRRLAAKGDVSYGVYIYAFPIQQSLVATLGSVNPLVLTAVAAPIVWLIGLASWRFVERPMLKRKSRRRAPDVGAYARAGAT